MSKVTKVSAVSYENNLIGHHTVDISDYDGAEGEKFLSHGFIMDSYRKIMGRTLTIIDASISEKQQNKAMKDLVRQIFSDEMESTNNWAFDQELLNKAANRYFEKNPELLTKENMVSIEEALGVEV